MVNVYDGTLEGMASTHATKTITKDNGLNRNSNTLENDATFEVDKESHPGTEEVIRSPVSVHDRDLYDPVTPTPRLIPSAGARVTPSDLYILDTDLSFDQGTKNAPLGLDRKSSEITPTDSRDTEKDKNKLDGKVSSTAYHTLTDTSTCSGSSENANVNGNTLGESLENMRTNKVKDSAEESKETTIGNLQSAETSGEERKASQQDVQPGMSSSQASSAVLTDNNQTPRTDAAGSYFNFISFM